MQVDAVFEEDEQAEEADIGGVWMIGAVEATEEVKVNHVETEAKKLTRESGMCFHVARVQKPLASAAKVVAAGNRIVMSPEGGESFIENIASGERLALRVDRGTYVFDLEYADGVEGAITLDSGCWCECVAEGLAEGGPDDAKAKGP